MGSAASRWEHLTVSRPTAVAVCLVAALAGAACATSSSSSTSTTSEQTTTANKEVCNNGTDDDGDGVADCKDSDCREACAASYERLVSGDGFTCGRTKENQFICTSREWHFRTSISSDWEQLQATGRWVCAVTGGGRVGCIQPSEVGEEQPESASSTFDTLVDWQDSRREAELPESSRNLAVGRHHICAASTGGDVYCWGRNDDGQAGTSRDTNPVNSPRRVAVDSPVVDVGVGLKFSCALDESGRVYCWGNTALGQLGRGTENPPRSYDGQPAPEPKVVQTDERFERLALGYRHACGKTGDGDLYCWGSNASGQIGDGTFEEASEGKQGRRGRPPVRARTTPTAVGTSRSWKSLYAGHFHTCAIDEQGATWCWGKNKRGHLGVGALERKAEPTKQKGAVQFESLALGTKHGCGLDSEGTPYCWGNPLRDRPEELRADPKSPLPEAAETSLTPFTVLQGRRCREFDDGGLLCPELEFVNERGLELVRELDETSLRRLGIDRKAVLQSFGEADGAKSPLSIEPVAIGNNGMALCIVDGEGRMMCSGDNWYGQLGVRLDRRYVQSPTRPDIEESVGWRDVALSHFHGCGVARSGQTYCWGTNSRRELGVAPSSSAKLPQKVVKGRKIVMLTAGYRHTCGVTESGGAVCWGSNSGGELGRSTEKSHGKPGRVEGVENVEALEAAGRKTCARTEDGEMTCWGTFAGGDDSSSDEKASTPQPIELPASARAIGVLPTAACALLEDGRGYCWGGELGNEPMRIRGATFESLRAGNQSLRFWTGSSTSAALLSERSHIRTADGITLDEHPPFITPNRTFIAVAPPDRGSNSDEGKNP